VFTINIALIADVQVAQRKILKKSFRLQIEKVTLVTFIYIKLKIMFKIYICSYIRQRARSYIGLCQNFPFYSESGNRSHCSNSPINHRRHVAVLFIF